MPFTQKKVREILSGLKETYVGLHTGEPNPANEISKEGYSRKRSHMDFVSENQLFNKIDIVFDPAKHNYGFITHIGIYSMEQGGELLYWIKAEQAREVLATEEYKISKHNMTIEIVV